MINTTLFLRFLDSTSDAKPSLSSTSSASGNSLQKKSVLVGQRPGIKVSKMLSQFKSYSQPKKNPVLSQRPSVFSSPDDEEEEEETDYSKFLEMKGNSRHACFESTCDHWTILWFLNIYKRNICLLLGIFVKCAI